MAHAHAIGICSRPVCVSQAIVLNRVFRWTLPFGYYPLLLVALFMWGQNPGTIGWGIFWAVGWIVLSVVCGFMLFRWSAQLHGEREHVLQRLHHTVDAVNAGNAEPEALVEVLEAAFDSFDIDGSGDISKQEMRELMEALYPHLSRAERAEFAVDVKKFTDSQDCLDLTSFIDAIFFIDERARAKAPPAGTVSQLPRVSDRSRAHSRTRNRPLSLNLPSSMRSMSGRLKFGSSGLEQAKVAPNQSALESR